jgi:hypothetical protein
MFCLGAAFSLWLLFQHEWPYSPYPQDIFPANPTAEAVDLDPVIPIETDELPAPLSTSDSAQDSEEANQ